MIMHTVFAVQVAIYSRYMFGSVRKYLWSPVIFDLLRPNISKLFRPGLFGNILFPCYSVLVYGYLMICCREIPSKEQDTFQTVNSILRTQVHIIL